MIYLRGSGLEIGALNRPLRTPPVANVKYVDCSTLKELKEAYALHGLGDIKAPDFVTDGNTLPLIEDSTQDFVIANHFLEHCEDPIGTFKHFLRVLRVGGILFLALPDKRFTFDVDRSVTSFEHILKDHVDGPGWSRREHFEEFDRVVLQDADVERIERDVESSGHTHFHVWSQTEMLTMMVGLKTLGLDFEVEAYAMNVDEGIFILRKGEAGKDRIAAEMMLQQLRKADEAQRQLSRNSTSRPQSTAFSLSNFLPFILCFLSEGLAVSSILLPQFAGCRELKAKRALLGEIVRV